MKMYLVTSVVLFTFMLSHWEKYNTGMLFLPWSYDISQLVSFYLVYHDNKFHMKLKSPHFDNRSGKITSHAAITTQNVIAIIATQIPNFDS